MVLPVVVAVKFTVWVPNIKVALVEAYQLPAKLIPLLLNVVEA